jgi:hypothetical protein
MARYRSPEREHGQEHGEKRREHEWRAVAPQLGQSELAALEVDWE